MNTTYTKQTVPAGYEVYKGSDGLWYAIHLTDVSCITIYCGSWEYKAVDAACADARR